MKRGRLVVVSVLVTLVVVGAAGIGFALGRSGRTSVQAAVPASSTTTTASPTAAHEIVGTTDTNPGHWTQVGSTQRFTVRVYGDQPSIIQDRAFQSPTMNGCADGQVRIRWRSLGEPVIPGLTGFLDAGVSASVDDRGPLSSAGSMVMNQCEQPAWRVPTASHLVDLAVEVEEYQPAVGN